MSLEVSFTERTNKRMKHPFNVVENGKSDAPSLLHLWASIGGEGGLVGE